MRGDPVPSSHSVSRYCRPSALDDDGRITSAAFLLRPARDGVEQEEYLSTFWLEVLEGANLTQRIESLRVAIHPKWLKLAKNGRFAILSVGTLQMHVKKHSTDGRWLRVLQLGDEVLECYSGIFDTSKDEEEIAELITEVIAEDLPALAT